ncbi:Protease Do-like 2, chloroplastic, partial [Capsicum annuum]
RKLINKSFPEDQNMKGLLQMQMGGAKKGKGVLLDSKDQQVETGSIQNSAFLNAVVKVYCTHTAPDYSLPWQKQRQYKSTGSALMIADGKFLTNAHCVQHDTQGDVIVSFDGVHVGCEGTVPFRSSEHIAFCYLISQKFAGDSVEVGIIRAGEFMKVQAVLKPRVHLVPYHIEGGQPSYLVVAGLVFTPLSIPLIQEERCCIGQKLLTKARHSSAKFEGEQIVVLSQVLANEVNIGYEDMSYEQGQFLVFEFEGNNLVVVEREEALSASASILKDYGIPKIIRSSGPYIDSIEQSEAANHGDSPVSNQKGKKRSAEINVLMAIGCW